MRSCYKCCHTDGRTHTMDDGDIMIDGETFRVMIYLMIIQFSIELELMINPKCSLRYIVKYFTWFMVVLFKIPIFVLLEQAKFLLENIEAM